VIRVARVLKVVRLARVHRVFRSSGSGIPRILMSLFITVLSGMVISTGMVSFCVRVCM